LTYAARQVALCVGCGGQETAARSVREQHEQLAPEALQRITEALPSMILSPGVLKGILCDWTSERREPWGAGRDRKEWKKIMLHWGVIAALMFSACMALLAHDVDFIVPEYRTTYGVCWCMAALCFLGALPVSLLHTVFLERCETEQHALQYMQCAGPRMMKLPMRMTVLGAVFLVPALGVYFRVVYSPDSDLEMFHCMVRASFMVSLRRCVTRV
jgi:hypothetical protein